MHIGLIIATVLSLVLLVKGQEISSKVPSDGSNLSDRRVDTPVSARRLTQQRATFIDVPLRNVRVKGEISRVNSRMSDALNGRLSKTPQMMPSSDSASAFAQHLRGKRQVYYGGYDGFYDSGYYHHGGLWDYGYAPSWYDHHW